MTEFATLGEFIAHLQQAVIMPLPDDEEWGKLIARITTEGKIAEILGNTYWYFLEVLPPKYQNTGGLFAFAEGAESLRIFWRKTDNHFCRQLTWDETTEFCRLARIPLPT